jgi:hypothetical protein
MIRAAFMLFALAACAPAETSAPRAPASQAEGPPRWEIMQNIRFAVFSENRDGDYDLMVSCAGDATLRLFYRVEADEAADPAVLSLRSGDVSARLDAEQTEDRLTPPPVQPPGAGELQGYTIAANLPRDAPVLAAFVQSGDLTLSNGRAALDADAGGAERAALRAFFEACV